MTNIDLAVIVHCWEENGRSFPWYGQLADSLQVLGVEVARPDMPKPKQPVLAEWTRELSALIRIPEQTVVIGHSAGAATAIKYAHDLAGNGKLGGMILVSSSRDYQVPQLSEFAMTGWNFGKARANLLKGSLVVWGSKDPYVGTEEKDFLRLHLGAQVIECHGHGHFSRDRQPFEGPPNYAMQQIVSFVTRE